MTGAVLDRPGTDQFDLDGGLTLEELLNQTLHGARRPGSAECPVCQARMTVCQARMTSTRASAGDFVAVCGGCGSRLS